MLLIRPLRPRAVLSFTYFDTRCILAIHMKYLGLDYGSRHIGIALSDPNGSLAFSHSVIPNDDKALSRVAHLAQEEKVGHIIMGDTCADNGAHNTVTADAERFASALARATGLPVARASETWTSFEAARYAPGSHHDDAVAAAIILQRFIDMKNTHGGALPEEIE